jgi:hypothetical protein
VQNCVSGEAAGPRARHPRPALHAVAGRAGSSATARSFQPAAACGLRSNLTTAAARAPRLSELTYLLWLLQTCLRSGFFADRQTDGHIKRLRTIQWYPLKE